MERDRFMSPQEAKEFGLIDSVLEHPPAVEEEHKQETWCHGCAEMILLFSLPDKSALVIHRSTMWMQCFTITTRQQYAHRELNLPWTVCMLTEADVDFLPNMRPKLTSHATSITHICEALLIYIPGKIWIKLHRCECIGFAVFDFIALYKEGFICPLHSNASVQA